MKRRVPSFVVTAAAPGVGASFACPVWSGREVVFSREEFVKSRNAPRTATTPTARAERTVRLVRILLRFMASFPFQEQRWAETRLD